MLFIWNLGKKEKLVLDFFFLILFALGYGVFAVTNFEGKIFFLRQPGEVITIKKGRRRDGHIQNNLGCSLTLLKNFKKLRETSLNNTKWITSRPEILILVLFDWLETYKITIDK